MTTLFDQMYDAGKEALKGLAKPLVAARVKSKFTAYIQKQEDRILEANQAMFDERSNLVDFDPAQMGKHRLEIEKATKNIERANAEKVELLETEVTED